MKKNLFIWFYFCLIICFITANDLSEDINININNKKSNKKIETLQNTKLIRIEVSGRIDTFRLNEIEEFTDFLNSYIGTSLYYYDFALGNNPEWNLFAFFEFPYINFMISNKFLWNGRITLSGSVSSLLLYNGNTKNLDDDKNTDEFFYGYFIRPSLSFNINPYDRLNFFVSYSGFINLYYDDDNASPSNYTITPNHYTHNLTTAFEYKGLGDEDTKGVYSNTIIDFMIRHNNYYWGYDNNKKIEQFASSIQTKNYFRIPLVTFNKTYFEFNIEGYYSFNDKFDYGTKKLILDPSRYLGLELMNGYNERELSFDKGLKFQFTSNLNVYSKKFKPIDQDNKIGYLNTYFDINTYFIYNIMYFNDSFKPDDFYNDNNLVNGIAAGLKFSINPVYKCVSHKFVISFDTSYGFDIYGYQNRFDRLIFTIGAFWSISI